MKVPYWQVVAVPLAAFWLGLGLNQIVLVANGGKFPVMASPRMQAKLRADAENKETFDIRDSVVRPGSEDEQGQFYDNIHSQMGPNSRAKFLADWITLNGGSYPPFDNLVGGIYSPGDFLILAAASCWPFVIPAWALLMVKRANQSV